MSGLFRRNRPAAEATKSEVSIAAGTDLDRLVGDRPATQRRGRLRRRMRHLRSVREVLFRDLGGLVFETHRAGGEHQALLDEKLARLGAVDGEVRELEAFFDDRRGMVVREPGIGGTCPVCGELFGSDARFCWACGTPVAPGATRPPAAVRAGVEDAQRLAYVEGTAIEAAVPAEPAPAAESDGAHPTVPAPPAADAAPVPPPPPPPPPEPK